MTDSARRFVCPDCGSASSSLYDLLWSYCGTCHEFKYCAVCLSGPVSVEDMLCATCWAALYVEPEEPS
jgi:hypothetical protein